MLFNGWRSTFLLSFSLACSCLILLGREHDDDISTRKALQTVAAGQKAENLLDFDDVSAEDGQPSGLAATTLTSTPAAANLLAGTSSNPLDDLVSIFGGTSMGGGVGAANGSVAPAPAFSFAAMSPVGSSAPSFNVASPVQPQKQEEDLLGLF